MTSGCGDRAFILRRYGHRHFDSAAHASATKIRLGTVSGGKVRSNRNEMLRTHAVGCCDASLSALGGECVAFGGSNSGGLDHSARLTQSRSCGMQDAKPWTSQSAAAER